VRERRAQRSDSSIDAAASSRVAGYGVHSSNTIAISESSACWTCIEISGVSSSRSPLTGDANATPSSRTLRKAPRLQTWNPAGIGEERALPAHEAMQAAMRGDHLDPRPQPEMERIAEHDLRAERFELVRRHRLDRPIGADRHEDGRVDGAVRSFEPAAARAAGRRLQRELHRGDCSSASRRPRRAHGVSASRRCAFEQHRIAVAEEAVAIRDGMGVRGADVAVAGERRHEHQQRRLREVEVRAQPFDDAKPVAGRDEQPRFGFTGVHLPDSSAAASSARRLVVPIATIRPPRARAASIGGNGLGRNAIALGVHPVSFDVVAVDRLERPGADVKRDERRRDAGKPQALRASLRRSASLPSAPLPRLDARINRLVARRIRDVGGTRECMAAAARRRDARDNRRAAGTLEPQPEESSIALDDGRLHVARQQQLSSGFGGWLARSWNTASSVATSRSSKSSTRPPVGRRAKRRALITRVSLNTKRSFCQRAAENPRTRDRRAPSSPHAAGGWRCVPPTASAR
jgi:hypothetical protein